MRLKTAIIVFSLSVLAGFACSFTMAAPACAQQYCNYGTACYSDLGCTGTCRCIRIGGYGEAGRCG